MKNYKALKKAGKGRQRLTRHLQRLCADVAVDMAEDIRPGTEVVVGKVEYKVIEYQSHIGSLKTIAAVAMEDYGPEEYAIVNGQPGSGYYMHGDFSTHIMVAPAKTFVHFARNLSSIAKAFAVEQEATVSILQEAFARLREIAESEQA